jgi:VWFA-related protein
LKTATTIVIALLLVADAPSAQPPAFRAGTDAVSVDVSVTRGGVPVPGLTRDDFELTDSNVAQGIDDVSVGTVPLNLLLALDVSGSINGAQLAYLKQAAHAVVNRLRPIDHVALMTFSNVVRREVDWSTNTPTVHEVIDKITGSWRTSLYDALSIATSMRAGAPSGRMHVLLVSDGYDTTSWLSPLVALSQLRRSDLVVHVVRLSFPTDRVNPSDLLAARERRQLFLSEPAVAPAEFLPMVAEDSGGELVDTGNDPGLEGICARLVESYRFSYVLSYAPAGVAPHGWHPLTVSVKNHRGNVIARRGYDR